MAQNHIWRTVLFGVTLFTSCTTAAGADGDLTIPCRRDAFVPGNGCQWLSPFPALKELEHNPHYLAPPKTGQSWHVWYARMLDYRKQVRDGLHSHEPGTLLMTFDGVRSWVRAGGTWAFAADLMPGETITLRTEARWIRGNNQLCLAFDFCDRTAEADGIWQGWSTVVADTYVPKDGGWHACVITAKVPDFRRDRSWARPILGMDGTFNPNRGQVELRSLEAIVPSNSKRVEAYAALHDEAKEQPAFDRSIYDRDDLQWMSSNFVCGFLFMYDRSFWDAEQGGYQVDQLCENAKREFGGFDSVVLWHDYPRIGADDRNQFDFFRQMPGGLAGMRKVVGQFHDRDVKVFVPYMPWDTGTRRDALPDQSAVAQTVAAMDADGVFLDTMLQSPLELRKEMDALKLGVAFAPEGHPAIMEMERCNGSWAQWLQPFSGIGALHLKWLEPRHIQHQIRRWDSTHRAELDAAWINGSGVLVWENIFGSFNPWQARDRADLRRMVPVLRHFASILASDNWQPCLSAKQPGVVASCWHNERLRFWTFVNQNEEPISDRPILEVEEGELLFFDLWRGLPLIPKHVDGRSVLSMPVDRYSAVVAVAENDITAELRELLDAQNRESILAGQLSESDPHVAMRSVIEPTSRIDLPTEQPRSRQEMLEIGGGVRNFQVRHMRRECGCYPDPGTPRDQWSSFLSGTPHNGTLEHNIIRDVEPCWIDEKPVTNAEFEAFLKATGYRPDIDDRFLKHWRDGKCPDSIRNEPVVYVDLNDARAYAKWGGKRLPTEWQWQAAAADHGHRFERATVHEWTESYRDDGHTRFVMLRGGCSYQAKGSIWYFPGGPQPIDAHAKFLLMYPGLDRCSTIGFRCVASTDGK